MDTLPLPPKPNLNYYKKRAKALVAAARSDQDTAVERWARDWIESLVANLAVPTTAFVHASINRAVTHIDERVRKTRSAFTLADAQLLIADAHGFQNWAAFSQHLDRLSGKEIDGDPFELAADAIVTGDLDMLDQLLRRHPGLIRAHSHRVHRATLLHYVAANGVEDFRQKTPANALAIARRLLEAGAAVDARANTYSGGPWETTMNLLVSSTHPAGAGVQAALVDVLLDFGAAVNGVADDASPMLTALDFGYLDAAETLARRGARIDNVVVAAALGRLDLVQQFVIDKDTLAPGVPLILPAWAKLTSDRRLAATHIGFALVWSCKFGRSAVAMWLLEMGVSVEVQDGYKMTPLHWAAPNGMTDVMHDLLRRGAPLEVENTWRGTVLDSTIHFATSLPVEGVDYAAVCETLLQAGANVRSIDYPTGVAAIDAVLARF